jgi:hypothetical protein
MEEQSIKSQQKETFGKRADWNMALYDFERWSKMLLEISVYSSEVRRDEYYNVKRLFGLQCALIDEWYEMIDAWQPDMKEEFDITIKEINKILKEMAIKRMSKLSM